MSDEKEGVSAYAVTGQETSQEDEEEEAQEDAEEDALAATTAR
jgi:hypothetical protein